MNRINITEQDPYAESVNLVGWFDLDKAVAYTEATAWNGHDNESAVAAGDHAHERLYRTAGGRWVLHRWSQWQGTTPSFEFIDDDQAQEWLLLCGHDDAVTEHFGEPEPERGPGRPEVGNPVTIRLGELKDGVDAHAGAHGLSRAQAVRALVKAGLADPPPVEVGDNA